MITKYRVGNNRIYTTLMSSIQNNVATAYLDPQATKYTTTATTTNYFSSPINLKGLIQDKSFDTFTGNGDPNFVGIETLRFGPTINEFPTRPRIMENLWFDDDLSSIIYTTQSRPGNRTYIIFNRCLFNQDSSKYFALLDNVSNTIIEFRHCLFRLKSRGDLFYFFKTEPEANNTINIIKSVLDVDILEHHIFVGCVRDIKNSYDIFQERDYVLKPQIGYGPAYGTDLISHNLPKLSGYILKDNQPVIRNIHLFDKFGKKFFTTSSNGSGYYEIDLLEYNMKQGNFGIIEGTSDNEKSVVLDDLETTDIVYTEL